ncbi:putative membrane protein [Streptococcus mutans]|nr:putative membrane protein [Streptococcus mutans]
MNRYNSLLSFSVTALLLVAVVVRLKTYITRCSNLQIL